MKAKTYWLIGIIIAALTLGWIFFIWSIAPVTKFVSNKHDYIVTKVDDATNYETKKTVEDTCRASIASYDSAVAMYELYRDSDDKEERGWAKQARMRANNTASVYNQYILKNTYVWAGNVPDDIRSELEMLK